MKRPRSPCPLTDRARTAGDGLVLVCLLVAVAFAGCVTSDGGADASAPPGPKTIPWALTDCLAVAAVVPVAAEAVEARLPDGFRPWTPEEMGLPPQPTADAALTLEVWRCDQGSDLQGGMREDMVFGAVETPTDPPEALQQPEADYTPYSWQMLVPDTARRTHLQDAGVPVYDGSADLSGLRSTPAGDSFRVTWTMGGAGYTFSGTTQQPMDRGTVVEHELTAAADGFATWAFTVVDDQVLTGTGTVELPAGSLAAEIVGDTTAQAFLLTGHPGFEDGTITLPAGDPVEGDG